MNKLFAQCNWKGCKMTNNSNQFIRIEYYHDADPEQPNAIERFLAGGKASISECEWSTIVFDSVSEAFKASRWYDQFVQLRGSNNTMRQWSSSVDRIERIITGTFKAVPMNTVVTAHLTNKIVYRELSMDKKSSALVTKHGSSNEELDEQRGAKVFYTLDLPGRLGNNQSLPRAFSEVYYMDIDDNGNRYCQTDTSGDYFAKTHINAPNICEPTWEAISQHCEQPMQPVHTLIYGRSGIGKTKMAASYPLPMLVFFWDGFGNDQPYLERGKEILPIEYYNDALTPTGELDRVRATPYRIIQC